MAEKKQSAGPSRQKVARSMLTETVKDAKTGAKLGGKVGSVIPGLGTGTGALIGGAVAARRAQERVGRESGDPLMAASVSQGLAKVPGNVKRARQIRDGEAVSELESAPKEPKRLPVPGRKKEDARPNRSAVTEVGGRAVKAAGQSTEAKEEPRSITQEGTKGFVRGVAQGVKGEPGSSPLARMSKAPLERRESSSPAARRSVEAVARDAQRHRDHQAALAAPEQSQVSAEEPQLG